MSTITSNIAVTPPNDPANYVVTLTAIKPPSLPTPAPPVTVTGNRGLTVITPSPGFSISPPTPSAPNGQSASSGSTSSPSISSTDGAGSSIASGLSGPGTTSAPTTRNPVSTSSIQNTSSRNSTSSNPATGPAAPRKDSNPISSGAAAGIGVGCAIAGALIAAALFALLYRRRRRRRPARSDAIPLNGFSPVDKSVSSPDPSSPAGMIERNLPQPVEDQALGGEMSRLRTAIKNHVQSYYHTNSTGGTVDQVALASVAAGNMPLIASTLGSLLSNPATRIVAIRFCITWTTISRIDQNCEPSLSFLPPEVASCLTSINGSKEDTNTGMAFASRWRAVTATLLRDQYSSNSLTSSDPRHANISTALKALDSVVRPFANQQRDDRDRVQKLEEILKRGARFGFLLFSQPSLWDFDWNTPSSAGRGALVISPALVQAGDENGRKLPRPRVLEQQELALGLESYL
ncbi:MAG: hypothetical protein Q9222_000517 [Ikaeria aurantiellina]